MIDPQPPAVGLIDRFRQACEKARVDFALPPGPPPPDRIVESHLDIDRILQERDRDGLKMQLRDIFTKAHGVFRTLPADDPDCQASFRELAFWNAIRILMDFSVGDMATTPAMAARAMHPTAIWEYGMNVRLPGQEALCPLKICLPMCGHSDE